MKIITLVASVLFLGFLIGCLGRAPGDYPGRTDGAPASDEAFASRNGSRLKSFAGYRCADGTENITGALFDTQTNARCYLAGSGPFYCAPYGLDPNPARDVRCDAVITP